MQTLTPPTIDLLKSLEPLASISTDELAKITDLMERQHFSAGETLINEAAIATQFYILIKGKLQVIKSIQGGEAEILNTIERSGELFGEMALVEDKPRSAGIIAQEDSEVLVVQKEGFLGLVNQFPQFTLEVAKSISNYLRRTDVTLIGTLEEKNIELQKTIIELQETRQAMLKNERLSIIGRMASTILHDLKNPMTTIAGFAQLIGLKEMPRADVIKYTDVISQQVSQFNTLAQELLSFAKGGSSLNLASVSYPACFNSILTTIQFNLVQQKMKLEMNLKGEATLDLDLVRFGRVFENLSKNAMEAMGEGGLIQINSHLEQNQLIIQISDNGHGMEQDVVEKVFDEFFSHHKQGGTGLGLAIVKSIVDDHQGSISVKSTVDQGTTFTIVLPLSNK